MKLKTTLWIASLLFAIAALVDVLDGNRLKSLSSVSITLAFATLAYAQGHRQKKLFTIIAYLFLCVSIGAFIFRFIRFYQVS